MIADTKDEVLRARLERIAEIRKFASRELDLPANGSYSRYTDLGRPFVSWTVFATPELSLTARNWCFPVAGCVSYRGYFRHADAIDEAKRLESQGDDVYVGNVPAYSTLGYFDDPVLSSFVHWPETEVARLIFHELAHQLLYVPGDTVFNESYAVTVERAGLERWLAHEHRPELVAQFERTQRTRAEFTALVRNTRSLLAEIYAGSAPASEKRRLKEGAFAAMKAAYDAAKADDPGLIGYEGWFSHHPNNANLAAIALYTDRVPAFRAMLREEGNDLVRFYAHVKQLAQSAEGRAGPYSGRLRESRRRGAGDQCDIARRTKSIVSATATSPKCLIRTTSTLTRSCSRPLARRCKFRPYGMLRPCEAGVSGRLACAFVLRPATLKSEFL